jgi:hypothetical protein
MTAAPPVPSTLESVVVYREGAVCVRRAIVAAGDGA